MKKMLFLSTFFLVLFLPLTVSVSGQSKTKKKSIKRSKAVAVKPLSRRAKALAAKRAEQARRRAAERARRIELANQAIERRFKNEAFSNIVKDNTVGEDLYARRAAIEALGDKGGTVLVMEAQTGKVLTMVNQDWAIKRTFKPCSTIKLVTAVAGVQEHLMDEEEEIEGVPPQKLILRTALSKSKNPYFNSVGAKVGYDKFQSTARTMGLGQPTGLNVDGEASGRIPSVQQSARQFSFGDGITVTPLQLGVLTSGIVNGGRKYKPTIVKSGETFTPSYTEMNVEKEVLQELVPGMREAAKSGTARSSNGARYDVAGKTGTCSDEVSRIGLFTSVAPVDNPMYSVVVIIRGRRDRTNGPYAAFIAGKIYQALLPNFPASQPVTEATEARLEILQ